MAERAARYVIIGNGIAGSVAARRLREFDRACRVSLLTDEPYPLYNRVRLPHYLKGMISREEVFMRSAEEEKARGIDFLAETTVSAVHAQEKFVECADGRRLPFDRLLIATGGRPRRLSVPGAQGPGVFTYQYLDDVNAMRELLPNARRAMVVGGSLIGYELVAAFREWNLETTWLIRGPHFMHRQIDAEAGALVSRIAQRHGVKVIYGEEVAEMQRANGSVSEARTTGGRTISCDLVGVAVGLKKNIDFLQGSTIALNEGVLTDEHLVTSHPDVYAAGDVAEFNDLVVGQRSLLGTWHNASLQGELVAKNMLGAQLVFKAVPIYSNPLFDSRIKVIGITSQSDRSLESLVKNEPDQGRYLRLFFRGAQLVGAVIIGKIDYHLRVALMKYMLTGEHVPNKQHLIATQSHTV
ncbi:MAG: NAD(P)/FAD-dependent oxidoreductase [Candidatus Tectomicrobia bacterium]|nr:NAD(P)/FAD-dependent oxidoreductase [Candidatus Tectomicrobia bacterium]